MEVNSSNGYRKCLDKPNLPNHIVAAGQNVQSDIVCGNRSAIGIIHYPIEQLNVIIHVLRNHVTDI